MWICDCEFKDKALVTDCKSQPVITFDALDGSKGREEVCEVEISEEEYHYAPNRRKQLEIAEVLCSCLAEGYIIIEVRKVYRNVFSDALGTVLHVHNS